MNGVLPDSSLRLLIAQGVIRADAAILPEQIQPASLDLRLGATAWRLRTSSRIDPSTDPQTPSAHPAFAQTGKPVNHACCSGVKAAR